MKKIVGIGVCTLIVFSAISYSLIQEKNSAVETSAVAGAITDYNKDHRQDLFVVTQANASYSAVMLISEGKEEGKFRLYVLRETSTKMPHPGMDTNKWKNQGLREINGPHKDVAGLDDALFALPLSQLEKLGHVNKDRSGIRSSLQCNDGFFCFWEHANFEGSFGWLANGQDNPNIGIWNLDNGDSWNDQISSWSNRTGQTYSLWEHDNFGGGCFNQVPGNVVQNAEHFIVCQGGRGIGTGFDPDCYGMRLWNDNVTSIRPGTGNCADPRDGYDCTNRWGCFPD